MLDLDYLSDFLSLGRRFASQEQHHVLDGLLASTLKEVDRIKHAESLKDRRMQLSENKAVRHPASSAKDTHDGVRSLITLADYRRIPPQD